MVIADNISREEAYKLKTIVHGAVDEPVELHIASSSEFENWYKRFIDKLEKWLKTF